MPHHPYMRRERAIRSRRDEQTMKHFRDAVLAEAEQFARALDRRMALESASRRTHQPHMMKASAL